MSRRSIQVKSRDWGSRLSVVQRLSERGGLGPSGGLVEKTVYGRSGSLSRWRAAGEVGTAEALVSAWRESIVGGRGRPEGRRWRLWQCEVSV